MISQEDRYGIAGLQGKMLEIFRFFHDVCEEHGLRYWLAGGTCLGALRHDGFIPWDDDLDVYMPRPDYERLWELMGESSWGHYKLCRTTERKNYHHRVMQLVDLDTTFVHRRNKNEDIEHGVYIDVIPIDACPSGRLKQFSQFVNAILFSVFNIQCKPEYNGGRLTGVMSAGTTFLLGIIRAPSRRYGIWKSAEARMTRYDWDECQLVKCITSQFHELLTPFPKDWFGYRTLPFEDMVAYAPSSAEAYCEAMYGDYMELPPEGKRGPRHNVEFVDLGRSYTVYKGRYYCVNE